MDQGGYSDERGCTEIQIRIWRYTRISDLSLKKCLPRPPALLSSDSWRMLVINEWEEEGEGASLKQYFINKHPDTSSNELRPCMMLPGVFILSTYR